MKKLLLIPFILFALYQSFDNQQDSTANGVQARSESVQSRGNSDAEIADVFSSHDSNRQITGKGIVVKLLPDDNNGSRHQKFIIRLASGQTLLVAHNIDLAPRVASIREGDSVNFSGEYEWNEKGGVLHWTHRDPNGSHAAGWLEHNGKKYQ